MTKAQIDSLAKAFAPTIRLYVAQQLRAREDALTEALGRTLSRTRQELRAELFEETNILRERLDLPIVTVRGMKPKVRVQATRGQSW